MCIVKNGRGYFARQNANTTCVIVRKWPFCVKTASHVDKPTVFDIPPRGFHELLGSQTGDADQKTQGHFMKIFVLRNE